MVVTVKIGGADVPVNLTEEQANEVREQIKATMIEELPEPVQPQTISPDRFDEFLEAYTRTICNIYCDDNAVDRIDEDEWEELNDKLSNFPYDIAEDTIEEYAKEFAENHISDSIKSALREIIDNRVKVYTITKEFKGSVEIRVLASNEEQAIDYVDDMYSRDLFDYIDSDYIDWYYGDCQNTDGDIGDYDEDAT